MALKKGKVPVELVRYPRSSHGLSRGGEPCLSKHPRETARALPSVGGMPNDWTEEDCLRGLHEMLRELVSEEEATRAVNPEKAGHLADAIGDLRIVIARLQAPPGPQLFHEPDAERSPGRMARSAH